MKMKQGATFYTGKIPNIYEKETENAAMQNQVCTHAHARTLAFVHCLFFCGFLHLRVCAFVCLCMPNVSTVLL